MPRGGLGVGGRGGVQRSGCHTGLNVLLQSRLEVSVADVQGFKIIFALKLSHHLF